VALWGPIASPLLLFTLRGELLTSHMLVKEEATFLRGSDIHKMILTATKLQQGYCRDEIGHTVPKDAETLQYWEWPRA